MKYSWEHDDLNQDAFLFNWTPSRDVINGTSNDDVLYGLNNKDDTVYGGNGDDIIEDKPNDHSNDEFWGQAQWDHIRSYYGNDQIFGGGGDDYVQVRAGLITDANGNVPDPHDGFVIKVDGGDGLDLLKISNSEDGHHKIQSGNWDWYGIDSDGDGFDDTTVKVHDVETIQWD